MKSALLKKQLLDPIQIQEIQSIIVQKVLKSIPDKSIEMIIRNIIFNPQNTIDWDSAIGAVYKYMPELGMDDI